jgi:hypothetical protein
VTRVDLIKGYYLATPVFLVLDGVFGLDLRAAFLQGSGARYLWYAACTILGLMAWRWPKMTAPIGLFESSVNFFLLIAAVMLPIMAPEVGPSGLVDADQIGLAGWSLLSFLLIGTACIVSFNTALNQLNPQRLRY